MYATLYYDADPTGANLYGRPVEVPHGDGTSHWEALVTRDVYDSMDEGDRKTFSKVEKDLSKEKWLKKNGDAAPRHVFGPPGNLGDPELEPEPVTELLGQAMEIGQ